MWRRSSPEAELQCRWSVAVALQTGNGAESVQREIAVNGMYSVFPRKSRLHCRTSSWRRCCTEASNLQPTADSLQCGASQPPAALPVKHE